MNLSELRYNTLNITSVEIMNDISLCPTIIIRFKYTASDILRPTPVTQLL